jgi:hypothetical protein
MLVEDYLRPAAVTVGVLKEGEKVRFGFCSGTATSLLRSGFTPTALSEHGLAAQDEMLAAMMMPSNAVN